MTILEAYKRFQLKLNSEANQDNVDISPGEFVFTYNEQQPKWYESKFKGRSSKFVIGDVQALAERDVPLTLATSTTEYQEYDLPDDYMDYLSSYCKATKGDCSDRRIKMYQITLPSREIYYNDTYNNPSFECKETFNTIASDKMQVYKTDFSVDSVFLTYYRYPKNVDIAGYTKIDQTASTNIDPELADDFVNEIIDWCVTDVTRTFKDSEAYQLSVDRLNRGINK